MVSPTHTPYLFAYLHELVPCVYVFFFLSNELTSIFNRYLCHSSLDVRMTLLKCLFLFFICIIIILIPAYVYLNMYTHFPSLPYLYTFVAIFICMVCVMLYIYTNLFVLFLLFPKLNRPLYYGAYWCNHTLTHILTLWFLLYFVFRICISTMVRSLYLSSSFKQVNWTMTCICELIET